MEYKRMWKSLKIKKNVVFGTDKCSYRLKPTLTTYFSYQLILTLFIIILTNTEWHDGGMKGRQ